ncbi:deoxyguanosinetriphosphate triphosphohydrolase [Motilibacter aurantiacus]|uniref:deoxyguanosinetriphosphate triphosphohydrolase n=1 Tax=Motilibacter aurantiacus TaxID=2714955 RepID=UPI00140A87B5|nr:deoxyguanosinetriphosphate triphosphohydrolase [Motilibacter aurantiacus]
MGAEGYDEAARERWAAEPATRPGRSPFERDRARVTHASGLRRLGAKTQVVLPWTDDFVRNRLTHSLEVAQVGRELGRALGCAPDVVETACLAHDLGHPPFGHNGEQALDVEAAGIGGFEGNAQTLRLLTRLEAKAFDARGRSVGLNLTRASLDATTKYPWARADAVAHGRPGKYGVYAEDLAVFDWLRAGSPDGRPCLEAQVMDWADDVAYSVHDVEDGVQAGLIDLRALRSEEATGVVVTTAREVYARGSDEEELRAALARLLALPEWPVSHDGGRRALAGLKRLTSRLVGRFSAAAEDATRAVAGTGPLSRYSTDLVVPAPARHEVAVLKAMAWCYVMQGEGRLAQLARQRQVVADLVGLLGEGAPAALPQPYREDWEAAAGGAARLRAVVDAVASLTDSSAVALHAALTVGR